MIHVIEYTEPEPPAELPTLMTFGSDELPQPNEIQFFPKSKESDYLKDYRLRRKTRKDNNYHGDRVTGDDTNNWMKNWSPTTYNPNEI